MAAPSAPPAAAALTVLLSVGASAPGLLWGVPAARSAAALRPAALHDGEVHRLITYIFIYEDLISLACGAVIIWYFAGSFEKNVGTAKHYGLGYCFCLDFPESVGSKLDRVFPFTLLRRIPGLKYIPGSLAERRASGNSTIIPVPGTYPTQSYHCPSPLALPAHPSAQSQGFHHSHTPGHQGPQQGRAAGYSLSSSHCQARGAFGECPGQAQAGVSPGQCCQLGKFPVPQRVCPAQPQPPAATGLLAGVQQAPGYPATPVAPVSAEFTRVQVY